MPLIDIPGFEGEFPRINSQNLKNTQAQVSINADHNEGTLKPLKALETDTTLSGLSISPKSIFLVRAGSGKKFWALSQNNAAFVRAPSSSFDGVFCYVDGSYPKKSNYALASNAGTNSYGVPDTAYSLSIPSPTTALTVAKTGTAGSELIGSMSYVYTWVNSWGHESAPNLPSDVTDVYEDEYVTLSGFEDAFDSSWLVAHDIVGIRIYRMNSAEDGTSEFQAIDELHTADGNEYGSFKYGEAQYGAPYIGYLEIGSWARGTGTITVAGTAIVGVGTSFVADISANDYIRAKGWIFKVSSVTDDNNLVIESTNASLSGVTFQYCTSWMESPGTLNDKTGQDIYGDDTLGIILQTEEYDEPEKTSTGITLMANNVYAITKGNSLRFSEPGTMNAYPYDYEVLTQDNIVASGNFGTTLVLATESYPYIVECYDPLNSSKTIIQEKQRCLFSRSLISGNGFIAYISPDGLILISQSGLVNVTMASFTKEQWKELLTRVSDYDKPVSAFLYDNKYFAFFEGTRDGFWIDLQTGGYSEYSFDSDVFVHGVVDAIDDSLDILVQNAGTYYVKTWGNSDNDLIYEWKSKKFFFPVPVAISCGKLFGNIIDGRWLDHNDLPILDENGYEIYVAGTPHVQLEVYADGEKVGDTINVNTDKPFRFQRTVANEWEFKFTGQSEVFSAIFSTTMDELFLQ